MYSRATQASSPQEVRQRLIDSRMGSGRSPQDAQLTSITTSALLRDSIVYLLSRATAMKSYVKRSG
jgi:hypothetical protein